MHSLKQQFESFYRAHIDKVYRYVYFRCHDKTLAEDLVSDIFMKAFEHFDRFDQKKGSSAWIITIAKNAVANYWRDKKPIEPLAVSAPETDEPNEDLRLFTKALALWQGEQTTMLVTNLLAHVSPEEADLVTKHYLFGYSYQEIAAMKATTEGAVKIAAHRAIKKMKRFL